VNHCNELTVVEEGYPFIETRLNGLLGLPERQFAASWTGR